MFFESKYNYPDTELNLAKNTVNKIENSTSFGNLKNVEMEYKAAIIPKKGKRDVTLDGYCDKQCHAFIAK